MEDNCMHGFHTRFEKINKVNKGVWLAWEQKTREDKPLRTKEECRTFREEISHLKYILIPLDLPKT